MQVGGIREIFCVFSSKMLSRNESIIITINLLTVYFNDPVNKYLY